MPIKLPEPSLVEKEHSQQLVDLIRSRCPLSFADYMQMALYAPALGYYNAGKTKFGKAGDYVTAPMISPLFSYCLARQAAQILSQTSGSILELGAGAGVMAADCLQELARLEQLPEYYYILELSPDLREQQNQTIKQRIPELWSKVIWLNELPEAFSGVIIANEVLDAMPVHRFHQTEDLQEVYVDYVGGRFVSLKRPASKLLSETVEGMGIEFANGYLSEINLNIMPWITSLAGLLTAGAILLIDYGFPQHEYYHPARSHGTLMCHYRHHAHDDPLILTGLQDITAHVNFTAVASAACQNGLQISGYTTQAYFLINCGLVDYVDALEEDAVSRYELTTQIKKLTFSSEMGELFKVIALTKGDFLPLQGFDRYDLRDKLNVQTMYS